MFAPALLRRVMLASTHRVGRQIVANSPFTACPTASPAQHGRHHARHASVRAVSALPAEDDPLLAETERVLQTGRPSKTLSKRNALAMLDLCRTVCGLSAKQLSTLAPVLGEELMDAVCIARSIPPRNQGRSRQENLIGKMLRSLGSTEQQRVLDAVHAAVHGQPDPTTTSPTSAAAEQLALYWRERLVGSQVAEPAGDPEVRDEVFRRAAAAGMDLQQLRQLLRQAQQYSQTPPAAAAATTTAAEGAALGDAAPNLPPSPMELAAAAASKPAKQQVAGGSKSKKAFNELFKYLRQVAAHDA